MPWYTTADARRDAEKQAAAKIDPLQNPGVQGLAQLGRNSIDRVTQLEAEIARLKGCLERANAQAETTTSTVNGKSRLSMPGTRPLSPSVIYVLLTKELTMSTIVFDVGGKKWKLVPIEPTEEMAKAFKDAAYRGFDQLAPDLAVRDGLTAALREAPQMRTEELVLALGGLLALESGWRPDTLSHPNVREVYESKAYHLVEKLARISLDKRPKLVHLNMPGVEGFLK